MIEAGVRALRKHLGALESFMILSPMPRREGALDVEGGVGDGASDLSGAVHHSLERTVWGLTSKVVMERPAGLA